MFPFQFALGGSGGTVFLTLIFMHAVDTLLFESSPSRPHALLKLDFANMFNSISRTAIRQALEQYFPELAYIFHMLYPPEGNVVWLQRPDGSWYAFLQQRGAAQGCPLSVLFSCVVLLGLLVRVAEYLAARTALRQEQDLSRLASFIDDTNGVVPLQDVLGT